MAEKLAVIKTGGKQYLVSQGDKIKIEAGLKTEKDTVVFDQVLFITKNGQVETDAKKLASQKVEGKVLRKYKAPKIIVQKFKAKKRYARKQGHRQKLLEIEITKI